MRPYGVKTWPHMVVCVTGFHAILGYQKVVIRGTIQRGELTVRARDFSLEVVYAGDSSASSSSDSVRVDPAG